MRLYKHTVLSEKSGTCVEASWVHRITITGRDDSKFPQEIWSFCLPSLAWERLINSDTYGWCHPFFTINLRTGERFSGYTPVYL